MINKVETKFQDHIFLFKMKNLKRKTFSGRQFYKDRNTVYSKSTRGYGCECNLCGPKQWSPDFEINKYKKEKLKYSKLEQSAKKIAKEAIDTLIKKHNDYGPNNISKAPGGPINGLAVRLHDKIERLNHLTKLNKEPSNESVRDTFIDIVNYAIIGLLVLDNKWDK